MKKIFWGVLATICLVSTIAFANENLMSNLDFILPGEVFHNMFQQRNNLQIGDKDIYYRETRKLNISEAMKVQNAKVSDIRFVYLGNNQDVYTVDTNNQLLSFSHIKSTQEENVPTQKSNISEIDAAITGASALGIDLDESQLDYSGQVEYGYQLNFKMGKDSRIEDWVMIFLDWDYSLSSLIVDNSGIDSMDEVNIEFFDSIFSEYCDGLELQPLETNVTYKYYGGTMIARYILTFEDEFGAKWVDMVSFADVK